MKKVTIIYLLTLIIISLFFLFIESYPKARYSILENIFSLDKSVAKIDAKVIGYSYDIKRSGTKGGHYYNYLYGIKYKINNQTYFARVIVAEHKNENYDKHLPLSKTLPIIVNKNKPKIFHFLYNDVESHFILNVFCLFAGFFTLYLLRNDVDDFKSSDFISKNRKDIIIYFLKFILMILFLSYPFYRVYDFYNSSTNGLVSEDISNYTLVLKQPVSQKEIERSKFYNKDPYDLIFHRNYKVYSDERISLFNVATLGNFSDKKIVKCFLQDRENNHKEIDFKFNNNDLEIIMEEEIDIKKPYFNIYIYSSTNQYLLPLDIIK